MVRREVHLDAVAAWVAWSLAVTACAFNLAFPDHGIGPVAVMLAVAGGTLQVRGFIHALECRELRAFDFGRKSAVRPLR